MVYFASCGSAKAGTENRRIQGHERSEQKNDPTFLRIEADLHRLRRHLGRGGGAADSYRVFRAAGGLAQAGAFVLDRQYRPHLRKPAGRTDSAQNAALAGLDRNTGATDMAGAQPARYRLVRMEPQMRAVACPAF